MPCASPKKDEFQFATFLLGKKSSSPTICSACLEVTTYKNPGKTTPVGTQSCPHARGEDLTPFGDASYNSSAVGYVSAGLTGFSCLDGSWS